MTDVKLIRTIAGSSRRLVSVGGHTIGRVEMMFGEWTASHDAAKGFPFIGGHRTRYQAVKCLVGDRPKITEVDAEDIRQRARK